MAAEVRREPPVLPARLDDLDQAAPDRAVGAKPVQQDQQPLAGAA
jgi:hypothetical protein